MQWMTQNKAAEDAAISAESSRVGRQKKKKHKCSVKDGT